MRNADPSADITPAWLGNVGVLLLTSTLLGTGILVVLLLLGAADPQPLGSLVVDNPLDSAEGWSASSGRFHAAAEDGIYRMVVPDVDTMAYLTSPYEATLPATIEVFAQQAGGSAISGYGIWWGEGVERRHMGFVINGNGYVAVFENEQGPVEFVRPWQFFPWVLPSGEINQLRIDMTEEQMTLRLNEEIVGNFDWTGPSIVRVGFIVQTFEQGGSVVAFDRLRIWQAHTP